MPTSAPTDPPVPADGTQEQPANKRLSEAAARALAEAKARRSEGGRADSEAEKSEGMNEIGGRGGLEPTRYGDWEVNGLASDF